jgi:hypothetical protein
VTTPVPPTCEEVARAGVTLEPGGTRPLAGRVLTDAEAAALGVWHSLAVAYVAGLLHPTDPDEGTAIDALDRVCVQRGWRWDITADTGMDAAWAARAVILPSGNPANPGFAENPASGTVASAGGFTDACHASAAVAAGILEAILGPDWREQLPPPVPVGEPVTVPGSATAEE